MILLNLFDEKNSEGEPWTLTFKSNLVRLLTFALSFFSAFTTKLKHNSQEYILEVVDTAGQVNIPLISPCLRAIE